MSVMVFLLYFSKQKPEAEKGLASGFVFTSLRSHYRVQVQRVCPPLMKDSQPFSSPSGNIQL
jgi:hypothetical protein